VRLRRSLRQGPTRGGEGSAILMLAPPRATPRAPGRGMREVGTRRGATPGAGAKAACLSRLTRSLTSSAHDPPFTRGHPVLIRGAVWSGEATAVHSEKEKPLFMQSPGAFAAATSSETG
jgi:hypothetical protein